ncbi:hypothetical protein BDQ17DRAFT_1394109 [Cyathus striatus]|nr:hypothetical protein BDQ17DRAFT_1394109 [Cyathus striatus]
MLRAFLIAVFGDIPAVSMVMHMKGHNGISPCHFCEILGLCIPNSHITTHYVPLNQSNHPTIKVYNPTSLPLQTHETLLAQAHEVQTSCTNVAALALLKRYGIKSVPVLSQLSSIKLPTSFPYDFMHLIWEGLDEENGSYEIEKTCWDAIGGATMKAEDTIPSVYGSCVPNIASNSGAYVSAEMWSFWTLYIAPVLLCARFHEQQYYSHFVFLVHLLNICLQYDISEDEITELQNEFVQWVYDYERCM